MNRVTWECDLPEGSFENGAIAVFQYLTAEGDLHFSVATRGDVPLSSFVGLLELGKLQLIRDAQESWGE